LSSIRRGFPLLLARFWPEIDTNYRMTTGRHAARTHRSSD
jgi:hypothetical protein